MLVHNRYPFPNQAVEKTTLAAIGKSHQGHSKLGKLTLGIGFPRLGEFCFGLELEIFLAYHVFDLFLGMQDELGILGPSGEGEEGKESEGGGFAKKKGCDFGEGLHISSI